MEMYGYISGYKGESPAGLSEVSFLASIEEIELLIEFLKDVREKHSKVQLSEGEICHSHLKDWDKNTIANIDLIIATKYDPSIG